MTSTPVLHGFNGRLLTADDPGYDAARQVWNAMVDRRPALIVRCTTAADVVSAIRFAVAEQTWSIAIRCGGHSIIGHAIPEDGLMIDLTPMGR